MPNYDSAMTGAKAMNREPDAYPATEMRKVTAGQISPSLPSLPSLTGILYDRRAFHVERVSIALSDLTAALDAASDDGFDVRYIMPEQLKASNTIQPVSPPSRFPRSYEAELSVTFNQPF